MNNIDVQISHEQKQLMEYLDRFFFLSRSFRLDMLLRRLKAILPPTTLVIWITFPTVIPPWDQDSSSHAITTRTHMIELNKVLRLEGLFCGLIRRSIMLDAAFRAAQVVISHGYDVLDLSYSFRHHALAAFRVYVSIFCT